MGYFLVRYNSRVVIYKRKMFIILATGHNPLHKISSTKLYYFNFNHSDWFFRIVQPMGRLEKPMQNLSTCQAMK